MVRVDDCPCASYKSIRFIKVHNPLLVGIYHCVILAVLLYVVIYTVWKERGYQTRDVLIGTTSVKIKGTAYHKPANDSHWSEWTAFDAMDVVKPANEVDSFFVTTAQIVTANQSRGICDGNSDTGQCSNHSDCESGGTFNWKSQGIYTGNCSLKGFCEVSGWCPLESDEDNNMKEFQNIGKFSAFVKANVHFPQFGYSLTNTMDKNGDGNPILGYNLFTVDQILQRATRGKIQSATEVASTGAIVLMASQWNCDFDKPKNKCHPKWKFRRIDGDKSISKGFNFRTVEYDVSGNTRRLRKLYGIRVILDTSGVGRRFDLATLTVTIGAGLAYLGIASLITDLVLRFLLPNSQDLGEAKTRHIRKTIRVKRTSETQPTPELKESQRLVSGSADTEMVETPSIVRRTSTVSCDLSRQLTVGVA